MVDPVTPSSKAEVSIHRLLSGPLQVFAPYNGDSSRSWFREVTHSPSLKVRWEMREPAHWVIGRSHLSAVAFGLAQEFGVVELVMDYRQTEKCGVKCQHATARDCTCSCLGRQHGGPSTLNHLAITTEEILPGRLIRVSRQMTAELLRHPSPLGAFHP